MLVMYVVNSSNVIILFRVIKRQFCYVMMTTASLSGGILKYKKKDTFTIEMSRHHHGGDLPICILLYLPTIFLPCVQYEYVLF